MRGRTRARTLLAVVVGGALVALAVGLVRTSSTPAAGNAPRAGQAAPTLVKHIAVGSISLPPALSEWTPADGGLAVDAGGNVYVGIAGPGRSRVAVFAADGRFLRDWVATRSSGGAVAGIAIGPDGLVYVRPENVGGAIRVYTAEGAFVREFGEGQLSSNTSGDLEVDAVGNIYATTRACCGSADAQIVRFNPAGQVTARLTPQPGSGGNAFLPGLALAPDGSIYVLTTAAARGGPQLLHLDASGRILPATPRLEVLIENPVPHDVDLANGRLYVALRNHGDRVALAVIAPNGQLVDQIGPGVGEQVAVLGNDVYLISAQAHSASVEPATHISGNFGHFEGQELRTPNVGDTWATAGGGCGSPVVANGVNVPAIILGGGSDQSGCVLTFVNDRNPCEAGARRINGASTYVGGNRVPAEVRFFPDRPYAQVSVRSQDISSGSLVVQFFCEHPSGDYYIYEWKGEIDVHDPSGSVLDVKTGRPVEAATVRLQFALKKAGPFGRPGVSGFVPQVNPQVTGRNGFFGWDVAEGFWRLRITAFGHRPFTSPVYKVPPEVKGLKLRLRQNPAEQARLIDPYAGRAGKLKLGAKTRRVAGLRVRVVASRIRAIVVRSKRFRTTHGITLGSRSSALLSAYPARTAAAIRRITTSTKPVRHRVGKATFTVRRARVIGITLGR